MKSITKSWLIICFSLDESAKTKVAAQQAWPTAQSPRQADTFQCSVQITPKNAN